MGTRTLNRLSARAVATAKGPKYHADGGGLYLVVDKGGARRWSFVFQWQGNRREMGLGSASPPPAGLGLAEARDARDAARKLLGEGINPIEAKRAPAPVPEAAPTFGEVALELIESLTPSWKHAKSRMQWTNSLKAHAPALWAMPVKDAGTEHVLAALRPIWNAKPSTAKKVRERMERVFSAAKVRGLRAGENPAAWRGHLSALLPRPAIGKAHFPSMPFADVPAFVARLREQVGLGPRALEFTLLTASRTVEVIGARWEEIDRPAAIWTIPPERMKGRGPGDAPHREPLSTRALEILDALAQEYGAEGWVFPSYGKAGHLSTAAMDALLERMGLAHFTVHGFRASFRNWAGTVTSFPRELAELSLSHVLGDTTERSYWTEDALERRRPMMEAWAGFVSRPPGSNVEGLRKAG